MAMIEAFVIVDGEKIDEMSLKYNRIKRQTFIDYPESRFFFTNYCAQYLEKLPKDLKDTKIGDYLNKLNLEPEELESIMSLLTSVPFGIPIS